ncbi:MAG: hypothetical protein K1W35_02575 [Lachnospiraceae bacterium]|jgi:pyruvate/2-oxoglutarate/acetoin dehydrogenase E1 component
MCNYVLNDVGYDNAPLEIIDPKRVEHIDEKKLSESITKNKKIIEQMRNSAKYRELIGQQNTNI